MHKHKDSSNYTDKRTGIVYTDVMQPKHHDAQQLVELHLDAFIPDTFLKHYFGGKGKL
jgi:hypothetical protein